MLGGTPANSFNSQPLIRVSIRMMSLPMASVFWCPPFHRKARRGRELFENEPGVLVQGERSPLPQQTLYYAADSSLGARTRSSSDVVEVRRPVGECYDADHLSQASKELQQRTEGRGIPIFPQIPCLRLPW